MTILKLDIPGGLTSWQASSGALYVEEQEPVPRDGLHRPRHRPSTSQCSRSPTGKRHVRHKTHFRLQDCTLRTQVRDLNCKINKVIIRQFPEKTKGIFFKQ